MARSANPSSPASSGPSGDGGVDVLSDLVAARASGNAARCQRAEDAVIVRYLSLASTVARRYQRRGVDVDDLEQVARLGLIKATRGWRADRGGFVGYAMVTVDGEVKRYFRDNGATIRIPRALYESQPRVAAAERELRQERPREPSPAEIAERAGIPEQQVRDVLSASARSHPLSTDECSVGDDLSSEPAEHELSMVDLRMHLGPVLATLSERERTVVVLRFIWDQTQVQIAGSLGISQMQVSRVLRGALGKLRERMAAWGPAQ